MQRGKPQNFPPIGAQHHAGQPAPSYSPHEVFLEGALTRFQHRMDKMVSILENGFETFNFTQTKVAKRLGKIYMSLDALSKHLCVSGSERLSQRESELSPERSIIGEKDIDEPSIQGEPVRMNLLPIVKKNKPLPRSQLLPNSAFSKFKTKPQIPAQNTERNYSSNSVQQEPQLIEKASSVLDEGNQMMNIMVEGMVNQEPQPQHHEETPIKQSLKRPEEALTKLGEFRDYVVFLSLDDTIEGRRLTGKETLEELKSFLCMWIGKVSDLITKETFHGYYTKEMSNMEMRVFLCNQTILAFHQMAAYLKSRYYTYWTTHKEPLIHMFQEQLGLALEYYLVKYPQKNKVFLNAQLLSIIAEKNELSLPQFSMINRLGVVFNPLNITKILSESQDAIEDLRQLDYTHNIKLLLNALMNEAKSWNDEFKKLMHEVFLIKSEWSPPTHLKEFQLSMKFREDTPCFSEEEIRNPGVPIHSPEVLRVLIKWIEQLDVMLREPERNILERDEFTGSGTQIEALMLNRYNKELTSLITEHYPKEFHENSSDRSIMDSAFNSLHDYVKHHRSQFNYLPQPTVICGMTVNLMSTLTCDIAVLYLGKLIGFFYAMHKLCIKKIGEQTLNFLKFDKELLPFTVSDLLRARCSCTIPELLEVIKQLQQAKGVSIVRVKNRLDTGNRDFLINFTFDKCRLLCEVQVGLKDASDQKGSYLHHFNHFLYELRRSKFGPLSESALIIANIIDVGAYFREKVGAKKSIRDILEFTPKFEDIRMMVEGYERQKLNFSFLCNNCLESCSNRILTPWKNTKEDAYLCGKCIYHKLDRHQRAIYALGEEVGSFYEEIDWKSEFSKKSGYLAVLTSETLGKTDFYSTKEPDIATSKSYYGQLSKDVYYRCFSKQKQFFPAKQFKNCKLFRLNLEATEVVLKIDWTQEDSRKPWLIDLTSCMPESKENIPYLLEQSEGVKYKVCIALSSSLEKDDVERSSFVRCVVDTTRRRILLLDNDHDPLAFTKSKSSYIEEKLQNRSASNQWKTEWNYDRKNFSNELLLGMPDDDAVQVIKMSHNSFTRLDLMRARSLLKLFLNHNQISQLVVSSAHYPSLKELYLINNGIVTLDFSVLQLPQLEILDVSVNLISSIITKRTAKESSQMSVSWNLKTLNLRFNKLREFDLLPTDLPRIEDIAVSFNLMERIDLTGFNCLRQFRAKCNSLKRLDISALGGCPSLRILNVSYNEFDMNIVVSRALEFNRPFLKKELTDFTTVGFDSWLLFQLSQAQQNAFKQRLFKEIPQFPKRTWEIYDRIADGIYTKAMEIPSAQIQKNNSDLTQLWKVFKEFYRSTIEPKATVPKERAEIYNREMKYYSVMQPKKVEEGAAPSNELQEKFPTLTIPIKETCDDCGKNISIPYYYGITSKKIRCKSCCEAIKQGFTNLMEKYIVNQSSVFVLGDRVVDPNRLGSDIQPKTVADCKPHSILCNGCRSNKLGHERRYICLGCKRQPSLVSLSGGFVDFCQNCADKLSGPNEQERNAVMEVCKKDGHKPSHSLLRVMYKVVDYYKY